MEERNFCNFCNFCYSPASHHGGFEYEGNQISGTFCDEKCFELWVQWKSNFIRWCVK
jgi:hypothetical protein